MTGASGFIGQSLAASLRESRHLTCIPHCHLGDARIGDPEEFYFLSSYGNMFHQKDRDETFKANLSDLLGVLRQLKPEGSCNAFVYLSSSSVDLPFQTIYSRAKRAAEEVLLALLENEDFPAIVVRPFSVTGVGEQSSHLIPTLIRAAFTGAEVDLVPWATHDFIDVADVVDGIQALVNERARGVFNLGSGRQHSNAEVVEIVENLSGRKVNIRVVDSIRPYDTDKWAAQGLSDVESGWHPRKTLEQSIAEMIDRYKEDFVA
jgi:nucleoside-diphosphate-sugar epimerase